jgi:hypothetical protein
MLSGSILFTRFSFFLKLIAKRTPNRRAFVWIYQIFQSLPGFPLLAFRDAVRSVPHRRLPGV